jgi:hypothetical protein
MRFVSRIGLITLLLAPSFLRSQPVSVADWQAVRLRVTPAMEAGVSDHVWSWEEVIALLN